MGGAVKTNWSNPIMPSFDDMGGSGVTGSGSDPLIDYKGEGGLKAPLWSNPICSTPEGSETANSVSGLPSLPNRFEPSETPPGIPDLTQRNPGTVDKP